MKRSIVWGVVSGWMVVSLLLVSCAPAAVEEKAEKVAPKYGGVHSFVMPAPIGFDNHMFNIPARTWTAAHDSDALLMKDWTKAAGGTNEWTTYQNLPPPTSVLVGVAVESWEIIEPDTYVYQVRQGVHYGLNQDSEASRLVGGREMTADDVVFSLRRSYTTPTSYVARAYPYLADMKNLENSIYKTDKWTVETKVIPGKAGHMFDMYHSATFIYPPEVVEKYGDMNDWENVVGAGPFILTDYTRGSSATFVRNPSYWMKDPSRPENQLPYLDGLKALIIPDVSTKQAALRAGKLDTLLRVPHEDAEGLFKSNPELERVKLGPDSSMAMYMRNDVAPFGNINVRRAMMMAINNPEIAEAYYGGEAQVLTYPGPPIPELKDYQVTLEELPEESRWLYEYHPDKARQLLAEAGYPNGFKTSIVAYSREQVDILSVIKAYWAEVGVDLEIRVKERSVWQSMGRSRKYEHGYMSTTSGRNVVKLWNIRSKGNANYSFVSETLADELFDVASNLVFDQAEQGRVIKEATPELISRAWVFALPVPYVYNIWQPWVKGYYGESRLVSGIEYTYTRFIWMDQELKEKMGH